LLERLRASGGPIRIERPSPQTNPPNAWARLRNSGDVGAEIVVAYDPADWPNPTQPDAPAKEVVLFRLFEHALALASGTASSEAAESTVSAIMETYLRERNGDAKRHGRMVQIRLSCRPGKEGNTLVFPYTVENPSGADVYVMDAMPTVDAATRRCHQSRVVPVIHGPGTDATIGRFIALLPTDRRVSMPVIPLARRLPHGQVRRAH